MRQVLGTRGERIAARLLRRRGYAIVARNYRCRAGEIDLVAVDGSVLVFVEVKMRAEAEPLLAIDPRKQRQIVRVARHFLAAHRLSGREIRFDVVGIRRGRWGRASCELVRDAFEAPAPI